MNHAARGGEPVLNRVTAGKDRHHFPQPNEP